MTVKNNNAYEINDILPVKCIPSKEMEYISLNTIVIEVIVLTGCGQGESLIPRIIMIQSDYPSDSNQHNCSNENPCFAMTINKAE